MLVLGADCLWVRGEVRCESLTVSCAISRGRNMYPAPEAHPAPNHYRMRSWPIVNCITGCPASSAGYCPSALPPSPSPTPPPFLSPALTPCSEPL